MCCSSLRDLLKDTTEKFDVEKKEKRKKAQQGLPILGNEGAAERSVKEFIRTIMSE